MQSVDENTAALAARALDLVLQYEALAADAKPPRGRLVPCRDARVPNGEPFDYGCRDRHEYGGAFSTCYSRARDADRELAWADEVAAASCGGGLSAPGGASESEWCAGCRENEQMWHDHRAAVLKRGTIKRQMCALGRRAKALAGCPDGEK